MRWRRAGFTFLVALLAIGCGSAAPDFDGGVSPELGAWFVAQRDCGHCHSDGHGTMAGSAKSLPGTTIYPQNLTPDPRTGLGGWADVEILRAIRTGIDDELQYLCPSMPHFSDMGDLEARSIVAYLRSLPPVFRPDIPESRCPPIKPLDPALWPGAD